MNQTTFHGQTVTQFDVNNAFLAFDDLYPDTNDYDSWLEVDKYKFALQHRGKLYPCKYILSQATEIPRTEFSGAI